MPIGPDGFAKRLRCPFCECLLPGAAIRTDLWCDGDPCEGWPSTAGARVTIACTICHKTIFEKEFQE